MNEVKFSNEALSDLKYWVHNDRKIFDKIYKLIRDIQRNGLDTGIGKPEHLKHRDGWSRRIDDTNRLVYSLIENDCIYIHSCKDHYDD